MVDSSEPGKPAWRGAKLTTDFEAALILLVAAGGVLAAVLATATFVTGDFFLASAMTACCWATAACWAAARLRESRRRSDVGDSSVSAAVSLTTFLAEAEIKNQGWD